GAPAPPRAELPRPRRQDRRRHAGRAAPRRRPAGSVRGPAMRYLGLLACLALVPTAAADDSIREEAAEADRICAAELPRWRLTADGTAFQTPTESVLRWTNPFAGRVYGNTYVWLQEGRPVAASCLFRYFDPYRSFNGELVALAGTRLVARRDDKVVWHPKDAW